MEEVNKSPFDLVAELGIAFGRYRRALKISQQRLQEKTGISVFTISQFENGRGQGLSLSYFFSLMEAVGLSLSTQQIIPEADSINPEKLWKILNKKGGRQ